MEVQDKILKATAKFYLLVKQHSYLANDHTTTRDSRHAYRLTEHHPSRLVK